MLPNSQIRAKKRSQIGSACLFSLVEPVILLTALQWQGRQIPQHFGLLQRGPDKVIGLSGTLKRLSVFQVLA